MKKLVIFTCRPCTAEKQRYVIMTTINKSKINQSLSYKLLISKILYYLI